MQKQNPSAYSHSNFMHKIIHGTDTTTLSFSYEATTSQPTSRILATSVARKRIIPTPTRNRTKHQNPAILTCLFSAPVSHYPLPITHYSSLITHIPKYRNQISTLLGVSPRNLQCLPHGVARRPMRCRHHRRARIVPQSVLISYSSPGRPCVPTEAAGCRLSLTFLRTV